MAALSLEAAKIHLRVDYDDEDIYIASLIDAAEGYIVATGTSISSPPEPDILHALKMLVGHWWENREAGTSEPSRAIAFGVDALLQPYREQSL